MNNFLNDFFNLAGKTVLITGASGQLGTELTEAYVAAGCKVIGMDLNKPAGDYAGVDFYEGSIAVKKDVEIVMTNVFEKYNGLDILINNAGVASLNHSILTPGSTVKKIFETNFNGSFFRFFIFFIRANCSFCTCWRSNIWLFNGLVLEKKSI